MNKLVWKEQLNIGVDVIDTAHANLFRIVGKLMDRIENDSNYESACREGIKYLEDYTMKHFSEEEAYMRSIHFRGYEKHKKLHDTFREQTLVALKKTLKSSQYSRQASSRFLATLLGWLTGHIMVEDRAITGRAVREANMPRPDDEASVIQALFLQPLQEMFGVPVRFMGELSAGDEIQDAQYYELVYHSRQGPKLRFVLVIGEPLLLRVAGAVFGIVLYSMNEIARFAIQEIAQGLIQRATVCFGAGSDEYHLEQERFLDAEEYRRTVEERIPQYRLLFGVKQDCFALCVDKAPE